MTQFVSYIQSIKYPKASQEWLSLLMVIPGQNTADILKCFCINVYVSTVCAHKHTKEKIVF